MTAERPTEILKLNVLGHPGQDPETEKWWQVKIKENRVTYGLQWIIIVYQYLYFNCDKYIILIIRETGLAVYNSFPGLFINMKLF